jgi:ABC-2 type transport system permease protein
MQTSWRRLKNNKSELFLTFIVPMVFFSIFALIFGSRDSSSSTPKIKVALCNGDDSDVAMRAVKLLEEQKSLRLTQHGLSSNGPMDREMAEDLVRRGMVSAAVVFSNASSKENSKNLPNVEVLTDSFDQVASQVLAALVQKAVMTASGEVAAERAKNIDSSPKTTNGVTSVRVSDSSNAVTTAGYLASSSGLTGNTPLSADLPATPNIEVVDVIGGTKTNPVVAMYAAGIAVMFLLFSATTASGSLLEERENSTLDRLLCSRLTMDQLLLGKWFYLTIIGIIQMTLMFVWGALVFRIELVRHLEGFCAMTIVTAGAAASFALMLASLCQTRMQLGWVSTIVILSMSALGGSMVPRYLMSENIQKVGMLTFNAWALEGYNKVFWRDLPLREIQSELAVLTACGFFFIVAARLFATRWERS